MSGTRIQRRKKRERETARRDRARCGSQWPPVRSLDPGQYCGTHPHATHPVAVRDCAIVGRQGRAGSTVWQAFRLDLILFGSLFVCARTPALYIFLWGSHLSHQVHFYLLQLHDRQLAERLIPSLLLLFTYPVLPFFRTLDSTLEHHSIPSFLKYTRS